MTAGGAALAGRVLREAEDRLRAEGWTGAQAFERLLEALRHRLGEAVEPHPVARAAVADLPVGAGVDLLGLAYERFFPDLFKGRRGQFFTPRPLVELLLAVGAVGEGDTVLDPTCGSGGFLVVAARRGARVRGIERDPLLATLARVNLRLAGLEGDVVAADFFAAEPEPVDVVVANPPFSVDVRGPVLERYELGAGRERVASDALFVEAVERWVVPGGRAALVLPWSLWTNPSASALRDRVDAAWVREATCALPEGVFRPFGGAAGRAGLLWLRRRPAPPVPMRWAELADPGYDVRSQRLKPTGAAEVAALAAGRGWRSAGGWTPAAPAPEGRPLASLASVREDRCVPSREDREVALVELGDADRTTGEVRARRVRTVDLPAHKAVLAEGDVLVARMRPELGNVAIAAGAALGSAEWIQVRAPRLRHFLLHALRTPTWREQLAVTGGQTRPRTSLRAVRSSVVPWPGDAAAARVDALSERILTERAALRTRLDALQALLDRFAAGEIDAEALDRAVEALELP